MNPDDQLHGPAGRTLPWPAHAERATAAPVFPGSAAAAASPALDTPAPAIAPASWPAASAHLAATPRAATRPRPVGRAVFARYAPWPRRWLRPDTYLRSCDPCPPSSPRTSAMSFAVSGAG